MTMTWIILKGQLKGQGVLHICKIWKVKSAMLYMYIVNLGSIVTGNSCFVKAPKETHMEIFTVWKTNVGK